MATRLVLLAGLVKDADVNFSHIGSMAGLKIRCIRCCLDTVGSGYLLWRFRTKPVQSRLAMVLRFNVISVAIGG